MYHCVVHASGKDARVGYQEMADLEVTNPIDGNKCTGTPTGGIPGGLFIRVVRGSSNNV
jgi:hypothetical protein